MILDKLFNFNKKEKFFFEADPDSQAEASKESSAEASEVETASEEAKAVTTESPNADETKTEAQTKADKSAKPAKKSAPPSTKEVPYEPPAWVKAIKDYSQGIPNPDQPSGDNFAGKYVSNNVSMSRRRPGGSMKKFQDLAKQIRR